MSARVLGAVLLGGALLGGALGVAPSGACAQEARVPDAAPGTVVDAVTGAPVPDALVQVGRTSRRADATGHVALSAAAGDTLVVRRVGYREARVVVGQGAWTARLVPIGVAARAARLADVRVTAEGAGIGRLTAVRTADEARALGAATLVDAAATLPFVGARTAQGRTALTLRGTRPEQVVVTLDGLPLTDPATGRAELADVPLAVVGAVTAVPGADALGAGPGAIGGVVALTTADRPVVAATAGSFGLAQFEGAAVGRAGGTRLRGGGSLRRMRNDFAFVNREGATGSDSLETRVNDDETRGALFGAVTSARTQLLVVASVAERGMAGPMNVRAFDADRGRTQRLAVRGAVQPGAGWQLTAGARGFRTGYDDARPAADDFDAASLAGDVEVARATGAWALRAGVGADGATATGISRVTRGRGFAAASWSAGGARAPWRATLGARTDAVGAAGAQLSPTAAVERDLRAGRALLTGYARAGRAFRAPTLYDLYFSSAQRIVARTLDPERVLVDAETGLRARLGRLDLAGALLARRTRDAIVWFPGNFGWSPTNVGEERFRGAEARLSLADLPTPLGTLALQGWGAAHRARLRIPATLGGTFLIPTPYVAPASGGAIVALTRGRLTVSGTLQALDRRPYTDAPANRALELPGVALVGARAALAVPLRNARRALVVAGVENVGGVEWQGVHRFPTPGRSWSLGITLDP